MSTFEALIIQNLTKITEQILDKSPDAKHNTGRVIGTAFMWDKIEAYAKKKSELAWKQLEDEEIIDKSENLTTGDHTLAESPAFSVTVKQTEPRKGFKEDVLQQALQKKYRVPLHTSKEMIAAAKVPGNPVKTFKIIER